MFTRVFCFVGSNAVLLDPIFLGSCFLLPFLHQFIFYRYGKTDYLSGTQTDRQSRTQRERIYPFDGSRLYLEITTAGSKLSKMKTRLNE